MDKTIISILSGSKGRGAIPSGFVLKAVKMAAGDVGGLRFVFKTVAFYDRVMRSEINGFFETGDTFALLDRMFMLIEEQFTRGYRQGLRDVGWEKDLTSAMSDELYLRIESELNHFMNFAGEMEAARNEGGTTGPFLARVELWSNRYNELVDMGALAGGTSNDLYQWQLGMTVEHCTTCNTLNGAVATRDEWNASGLKPQNAPNPRLECGGWRCDCRLVPVSDMEPTGIPWV